MKIKSILTSIFGTYNPPAWMKICAKKTGGFFKRHWKIFAGITGGIAGLAVLAVAGFFVYTFIQSKIPVEMPLDVWVDSKPDLYLAKTRPESNTVVIKFDGSAAKMEDAGKTLPKELASKITLKPAVSGDWAWMDDRFLVFTPSAHESWTAGATYKITLPKEIFAKHVKVNSSQVSFSIDLFHVDLTDEEFVIDDKDPEKKYVVFKLEANYPFDKSSLEGKITFEPDMTNPINGSLEKRKYSATVGFSDNNRKAFIRSEPLGTPATTVKMNIKVAEGIVSAYGGNRLRSMSSSVKIESAKSFGQFTGADFSLVKNPEQVYEQIVILEANTKLSAEEIKDNLELFVLPIDKPSEPGIAEIKKYNWKNTADVTDTVLGLSAKVGFEVLTTETEYEKIQSVKVDVPVGRHLYGRIKEGTKFYGGYFLSEPCEFIRKVPYYPKEINILSEGDIISMRGSHKIPVMTYGVNKVYFSVWRLQPDDINHLVSQSNGNLSNFKFSTWRFNQNNIGELYNSEVSVASGAAQRPSYTFFDFSEYLNDIPQKNLRNGIFYFKCEGDGKSAERLIMVTDLGVIHKKGSDGFHDFFVQNISTGNPVENAVLNVIALNGDVLVSGVSDASGHAKFSIPIAKNNSALYPIAYTVKKGNDFAFMPYEAGDRRLDYSDFDVGGEHGLGDPQKLNAFLFSDRGIYRPGDEVRMGLVLKANDWNIPVAGLPLIYTVEDSKGTEIVEKEFRMNRDGFDEIKFSTKSYSPTGMYTVYLFLKQTQKDGTVTRAYLGSEKVKVEEFLPDTLSISSIFNPLPAAGWIQSRKIDARVTLRNLFGTNAVGNSVSAEIILSPGYMYFPEFKDYKFSDPYVGYDYYDDKLSDKTTDENGEVVFPINIEKFAKASYRLTFTADGFEKESGRSVTTSSSVYISPLDYMVGVKTDGSLSYINHGSVRMLKMIAISPDLKQIDVDDAEISISENRYVSVLVRQPNGVYKYQSVKKEYPVSSQKLSIPKEGLEMAIPSDVDGDFVMVIKNANGDVLNKISYSIIGSQNLQRSLSRTAELEVKSSRASYNPGEEAELFIKAPYAGKGLITVEREKVYSYKWFSIDGTTTTQKIRIPENLEGNGYINITFLRDYNSNEIYMSPFCYAAVPFTVSEERRINKVDLSYPAEVKPDTDFEIKYSTEKPGKIVIFAVDEGILQVAKYKSPEPLSFFFRKQALQVSTEQLLDLVLPEYNILKSLGAAGGGEGYDLLAHNLNPFKRKQNAPVAFWSGIIPCDEKQGSVTYHIPGYFNGSMRVMAVAVSDSSIGTYSDNAIVKDTYVIVPNAPTFASPGDELEVSVTVTNNDKGSGENAKVKLSASCDKGLEILGSGSFDLAIPEGRDATVIFKVKAKDVLGNADIVFRANGEKESSKITTSLSVRPAMPYQVWLSSGRLEKDKAQVDVNKKLYDEYATRQIDLSYLPVGIAKGLSFYLEKYPYRCSEQVTSRAYVFLFPELLENSELTRGDVQNEIDEAVSILASRQKSDGTIGYWTYKSNNYPMLDAYIAMFLTDAREAGYYVPEAFMKRLLSALSKCASSDSADKLARAMSIYVLTRNDQLTTSFAAGLKKQIDEIEENSVATMFMAATYKMLQMDNEGKKLASKIQRNMKRADKKDEFTNDLFFNSAYLYLISTYYPEKLTAVAGELLEQISHCIGDNNYTSVSSAFTLLAVQSYLQAVPGAKNGKFTVSANFGKDKQASDIALAGEKLMSGNFAGDAQKVIIENKDKNDLFYQVTQAGYLAETLGKEEASGLEVYREFTDANGKKITSAKLGDLVNVNVNIRSKGGTVYNVAVIDMLPSGLEADIESVRKLERARDYIDIREDRVIFYGNASESLATFTYKARAISNGTFKVPPIFAEAMYDKSKKAIRPQDDFTVAGGK